MQERMRKIMEMRPISELMETTMQKVRDMIDANTIVGEPISTPDGITLIPVSKLTFGIAGGGGGADNAKKQPTVDSIGGGIGAGVSVTPVAFIVAKGESIKLLYVAPPSDSTISKLIDTVPDMFDKVTDFIGKNKEEK